MSGFEILPHTADVGFAARGETPERLFENAARALQSFTTGEAREAQVVEVELEAEDYEALLVAWLSEILFLFDSGRLAPARFEVEEATPVRLRARIAGEPRTRQGWRLIVKAITYHQLVVARDQDGWYARVYLDV